MEDAGPGIPPELRARVFEPFFRGGVARGGREGFGLGLPLAHTVARALGGRSSLEPAAAGSPLRAGDPGLARRVVT